jgi:dynein heavy chain
VRKADLDLRYEWCIGDCLISSAFLSYLGPFPSEYRDQLLKDILLKKVKSTELDIPHNK